LAGNPNHRAPPSGAFVGIKTHLAVERRWAKWSLEFWVKSYANYAMQTTGKSRTAVEGRSRESLPKKSRQAMGETLAVAHKKNFFHMGQRTW